MEKHNIGIISDTHGLLRPEVIKVLKNCKYVFHAGDLGNKKILKALQSICTVYAVRGNVDVELSDLPEELETELFGFKFCIIHNRSYLTKSLGDKDIVIYGHTHKYCISQEGNVMFLNSGSCGPKRFRLPVTMAVLSVYPENHSFDIKKIDCEEYAFKNASEKNMDKVIAKVAAEIKSGRSIEQIAARNNISQELAEQICRIYVTHPDINLEGILKRMEIWNL